MADSADITQHSDGSAVLRRCRSVWLRSSARISRKTGLQGKLVLCFMFLLVSALGSACWLFASETQEMLDRVTEGQAGELGRTLALTSQTALEAQDRHELQRITSDLLKGGVV